MSLITRPTPNKIPVILDTDIGTDIDDTWALAFLLRCPELDVKLITTASGDTHERARLTARLLEVAGRIDIPIGIGIPLENSPIYQRAWSGDLSLANYAGQVHVNGIQAMADTILASPQPVTVIGIGPLPNIAALLMQTPEVTRKANFVGMFGSLRQGYFASREIAAEYNVKLFPHSCRQVFEAPWQVSISPLDTCGIVQLKGAQYRRVRDARDPLARAVMENYDCWTTYNQNPLYRGFDPEIESSILYDLVPVYMAFSETLLKMETLKVTVSDDGFTREDPSGSPLRCAMSWQDLPAFEELFISRMIGA